MTFAVLISYNKVVSFRDYWYDSILFTLLICPQGDPLPVKVNKLTSIKTQLPYTYYSLPFCKPDTIVDSAENLGEVLRGDRIENSPYVVSTLYGITD
jgi:hypothetical protein